jgi:hypothetical protein
LPWGKVALGGRSDPGYCHIASAREASIAIGAFIRAHEPMEEEEGRRRIFAAAAIAVGILIMALG